MRLMRSSSWASAGRLLSLDDPAAASAAVTGGKAAGLARARQAGLPVLPGYVAPAREGTAALRAGYAALGDSGRAAARRAVLASAVPAGLVAEMASAVTRLGGRVIVRSSSGLDDDPRWSGAFSSIREIGPGDVAAAARSCWCSAFAPDPLARLERCGLGPEVLGLSLLVQPDLEPDAGGLARWAGAEAEVAWVRGHPGGLLAGAEDGDPGAPDPDMLREVTAVVRAVHAFCGDDLVEWAWTGGRVVLLQSGSGAGGGSGALAGPVAPDAGDGVVRLPGRACVPGDAAGRLRYAAPGRPMAARSAGAGGHILVAARPLPSLAPLLFGARGIVCQSGSGGSHLAGVARALGVPMLVQVPLADAVGPLDRVGDAPGWLAVISGHRAELVLVPAAEAPDWFSPQVPVRRLFAVDQDLQLARFPGGVNRPVDVGQREDRADQRAEPDLARRHQLDGRAEIAGHRGAGALEPQLLEIQLIERQLENACVDGPVRKHDRARAGHGNGQPDGLRRAHALHDQRRPVAAEQVGKAVFGVGGRERDVRAELPGPIPLACRTGHPDDRERAARLEELDVHEAGHAQADHHRGLPGRVRNHRLRVHARGQHLEQGRFVVAHLIREQVQLVLVDREPFGDAAVGVPAEQAAGRAQVGPARPALGAPAAVKAGIDEDP
jgi:phosphohistidine swiveling domain-containing protein